MCAHKFREIPYGFPQANVVRSLRCWSAPLTGDLLKIRRKLWVSWRHFDNEDWSF
uniref:Uncharacterized protein n=1 Tax=Anguilla anguilla TaxID=7936 RepID=A0A0E9USE5_ANGAN